MSHVARYVGFRDKKSRKVSHMSSDGQKLKPIAQKFFRSLSAKTPLRKRVDQTIDYIRKNHNPDIKDRSLFGYLRPLIDPIDLPAKNREVIRFIIKSKINHQKSNLLLQRKNKAMYLSYILHYADLNSTGRFYNIENYLNSSYFRKRDGQIIYSIVLDEYVLPNDEWLANIPEWGWGKRTFRDLLPFSATSDLESPLSASELCETLPEFLNVSERKILEQVLNDGVNYKQAIDLLENNSFTLYNSEGTELFKESRGSARGSSSVAEYVFNWGFVIGLALLLGWCVSSVNSNSSNSSRDAYMRRCEANGTPSSECSDNWDDIVEFINRNRN